WFSLDEDDNNPTRLWVYLINSLSALESGVGENALSMLLSSEAASLESVITSLINDLAAVEGKFTLVLDDYHVITLETIHQSIDFFVEHLPPQMHLVIAGRTEPSLPLALLRSRGEIMEFGAGDLRFSEEEAGHFLNELMGLNLSADDVAALENRTEGWIAGLQLAALSMQGQQNPSAYIESFAGDDRNIMDYLIEEVLEKQPSDIQSFLMETSILDRVTGSLCDAVTGRNNGQEMLEMLEQVNLFITSLDNKRKWFRYHRLFLDLLRHRLEQYEPEKITGLHHRAALWYESHNLYDEALGHGLASGDHEQLGRLLESSGEPVIMHGEVNLLLECLEALPDEMIRARPRLSLYYAWASLRGAHTRLADVEMRLIDAEMGLDGAEQAVAETDEPHVREILGQVAALRGALALRFDDEESYTLELSKQALEYLPEDSLALRGVVARSLGDIYERKDDLAAAIQAQSEALSMSKSAGDIFESVFAASRLGRLYEAQGQLHLAAGIYREALQRVGLHEGPEIPVAGLAYMGLGEILREWNDLESASAHLSDAIELYQKWGEPTMLPEGFAFLSRVKHAQGDNDSALELIETAKRLAQDYNITSMIPRISGIQARLWVRVGKLEEATRWLHESGKSVDDDFSNLTFRVLQYEYVSLARVLTAVGELDKAIYLFGRLLEAAEPSGRIGGIIEILVLRAIALQNQGKMDQALEDFRRALYLGNPEGFIRSFVAEGPPLPLLLATILEDSVKKRQKEQYPISIEYLRTLLTAFEVSSKERKNGKISGQPLAEPLSERELEVLSLLESGLSNREIGEALYVAVNTVKTHIRNIYGKLSVRSRTQAVARAKSLGLLR
ncbi:MAG: hypothetical protein JRD68_09975, partial [Deltaproteobacteria bacterium]|nr:hypothetical protein [Deltaproteobacteria bacterium]